MKFNAKGKINKCLMKLTRVKDEIFGPGFNFFWPFAVQIETTTNCNLHCSICNVEMKNRAGERVLIFERFKKILDQFPYVGELNLTGYGEPLLNADIFKMIKYAKSRGMSVEMATNATLLNAEKAEEILDSGLDFLIFSIDSASPEVYESIRQGAFFDKTVENVKNFLAAKKRKDSGIKIAIYSVVLFSELKEINGLIDFVSELGVSLMKIRGLVDHTGKNRSYDKNALYHPANAATAKKCLAEAKKYAKAKGVNLSYPSLEPMEKFQCRMPSQRPFVSVEGYVTPCCVQGMDPRNVNFGNVFEENFAKIWNNKRVREFRRRLSSKSPPPICLFCPRRKGMA